uniref:Uncharacterized protein n=1 Tax=Arundo donax TaxID=35708 RepID=A0A0A9G2Z1_ARUDO
MRDPVQERGAARGGRGGGADGAGHGRRGGVRVRVRAAAAAVGLLWPGGRGKGGVFRDVRRRGGRGRRAVPAVGARRHAVVAGVRDRPGDAEPVPVLLANYKSEVSFFFLPF